MGQLADQATTRHVVVLVHGIRTYGEWQHRLEALIREVSPTTAVHTYRYGYLSSAAFALPLLRNRVVKKFAAYLAAHAQTWRDARVDVVAHSFGTYIVARALTRLVARGSHPHLHTAILAGSVLRITFPWNELIAAGALRRVVNECGRRDIWPALAQWLILGMGNAGRYGFIGVTGADVGLINRYHGFGHSGFFSPKPGGSDPSEFMRRDWLPLLIGAAPPRGAALMPPSPWYAGIEHLFQPLKLIPLLLVGFVVWRTWVENKRESALAAARAQIAEGSELVRRDPVEALVLATRAERVGPSDAVADLKRKAIAAILTAAARRAHQLGSWSSVFGGKGYYSVDAMSDHTADGQRIALADSHQVRLFDPDFPEALREIKPTCREGTPRLTAVRISGHSPLLLLATQAFIHVYSLGGELVARTCQWHTKDPWHYVELIRGDSILLASANEGQIVFFEIRPDSGRGEGVIPLTEEFGHRERKGGAIVHLVLSADGTRGLSTHHLGYAFLWRVELLPTPRLMKLHEFGRPPSRGEKPSTGLQFKFTLDDDEFITGADMAEEEDAPLFLTTYKSGNATQWQWVGDEMREVRTLDHGGATVVYAGFSADGTRVVTVAADSTLAVWDAASGALITPRQRIPAPLEQNAPR